MVKALKESPGIVILDEGQIPRSTKSRLRKCFMKLQTKLRILLSCTLFENNFCEYFNTLCLTRPRKCGMYSRRKPRNSSWTTLKRKFTQTLMNIIYKIYMC
jgi:hypothetical protein